MNRAPREMTGNAQTIFAKTNWHRGQTVALVSQKFGKSTRFFANRHHRELFRQWYSVGSDALAQIEMGGRGQLLQEAKAAIVVPTGQWWSYVSTSTRTSA